MGFRCCKNCCGRDALEYNDCLKSIAVGGNADSDFMTSGSDIVRENN